MESKYNKLKIFSFSNPDFQKRFFAFLVWPFAAFTYSALNFRRPESKVIVWWFMFFFGAVFIYDDPYASVGTDSARYAARFIEMHNHRFSFSNLVSAFYDPVSGFTDVFQPLLSWFIAGFTDNPRWLFAFSAAAFGFFYVQNLWMVFGRIGNKVKVDFSVFLFITAFALLNPIWNINGVRWYIAAHVLVYGLLRYYLYKDKVGILWIILSPFFHFSFLFPVFLYFLFLILPLSHAVLIIFFFGSAFIREIDIGIVRYSINFLPEVFHQKVEGFTNQAYIDSLEESSWRAWHVVFANNSIKYLTYLWVGVIYIYRKKWLNSSPELNKLFAFSLFYGGWAHLATHVASGQRFIVVYQLLFMALTIIVLTNYNAVLRKRISYLKIISTPFLIFYIIFALRVGLEVTGFVVLFGNPILAIFIENQTPLIEIVKDFLSGNG